MEIPEEGVEGPHRIQDTLDIKDNNTMALPVDEHIKRHQELHVALDELIADYITHTKKGLGATSILTLMEWSYEQTLNPIQGNHET